MTELSDMGAMVTAEVPPPSPARTWLGEISAAGRWYAPWRTRGGKVIGRYKDENNDGEMIQNTRGRKMAMLWSNVETVKPALYSQTPVPNITRRNKDKDPVGMYAAMILERAVVNSLATQDFDKTLRDVVQDLLLPGRGMAIEEYGADITGGEVENQPEQVTNQRSTSRYLHWKDCLTNPARIWSEVWWFGYVSYLTRDEVAAKFGQKVANVIQLDHKQRDDRGRFTGRDAKASVWTVWDSRKKRVIQVSPGYPDGLLDDQPPPVKFDNFWPIPRPVQATTANDTIIPTPDFALYQDQADEIDLLTNKIYKLSESLRLRGLYPGDMDSLKRLLSDAGDTEMIPVEQWAMIADRGGMEGLVAWFPLKDVAQTLIWCTEARDNAKEALYEVTGMGDIIRGASDASETATAQQLKSQWGSLRIRDRQRDIQRFARDLIRLKAEVIAEHFTQQTLAEMSGVKLLTNAQKQTIQNYQMVAQQYQQQAQMAQQQGLPPPPQPGIMTVQPPTPDMMEAMKQPSWEDVMALLRNDKLRGFQIDVETDSTVEPDQQAEQQKAVEALTAMAQYLTAAAPIMQMDPKAANMLGEGLLFGMRRFQISTDFETAIENYVQEVGQRAQVPPPPDPKMQVEQIKAQTAQQQSQADMQTTQVKAQAEQQKAQIDLAGTVIEHQTTQKEQLLDAALAAEQHQRDTQLQAQQHQQAMQLAKQKPKPNGGAA